MGSGDPSRRRSIASRITRAPARSLGERQPDRAPLEPALGEHRPDRAPRARPVADRRPDAPRGAPGVVDRGPDRARAARASGDRRPYRPDPAPAAAEREPGARRRRAAAVERRPADHDRPAAEDERHPDRPRRATVGGVRGPERAPRVELPVEHLPGRPGAGSHGAASRPRGASTDPVGGFHRRPPRPPPARPRRSRGPLRGGDGPHRTPAGRDRAGMLPITEEPARAGHDPGLRRPRPGSSPGRPGPRSPAGRRRAAGFWCRRRRPAPCPHGIGGDHRPARTPRPRSGRGVLRRGASGARFGGSMTPRGASMGRSGSRSGSAATDEVGFSRG